MKRLKLLPVIISKNLFYWYLAKKVCWKTLWITDKISILFIADATGQTIPVLRLVMALLNSNVSDGNNTLKATDTVSENCAILIANDYAN